MLLTVSQEFIKRVYEHNGALPECIFYDTNCKIFQIACHDPFFQNTAFPVDVFHFNCKHSKTDDFCMNNCNPAAFPELKTDDGEWYFNSSAAEQTNSWLRRYTAICKEMLAYKFNFFLDELIIRRNRRTISTLARQLAVPDTWEGLLD